MPSRPPMSRFYPPPLPEDASAATASRPPVSRFFPHPPAEDIRAPSLVAPAPWANGWRHGAPDRLPPELWGSVLGHLRSPRDLLNAGSVCRAWHRELFSASADAVWRSVWDERARVPSGELSARVRGGWREQVAASERLAGSSAPAALLVPPREWRGRPVVEDAVETRPRNIDVEEVLGRARFGVALPEHALIAHERGVSLVCMCARAERPILFYDASDRLHSILHMTRLPAAGLDGPVALAATYTNLFLISVLPARSHARTLVGLRARFLHAFNDNGQILSLSTSADGSLALLGFMDGRVHVVCTAGGGVRHVLSMREPADIVAADGSWIIAASVLQPVGVAIWHASDGRAAHRLDRTAVGWEEIVAVAGLAPTSEEGKFILWNGKDCLRILSAETGRFVDSVDVLARFGRVAEREPVDEAERGAASAHVGLSKMVVGHGGGRVLVSTSNRVFVVRMKDGERKNVGRKMGRRFGQGRERILQVDGALRSLVALSTDERSIVTADGDAYGGLRAWILGRRSLTKPSYLCVWDAETGKKKSSTKLPCSAAGLSVCGNVAVVRAKDVGQVVVLRF